MCWNDNWRTGQWRLHCQDLRRELPSSIKSYQFWDAPFLGKAHGRPPPSFAGSLGCSHPQVHGSFFPRGFTHSAMLVSFVVALGKKRTQMYTFDLTPLVVVLLHKEMLQSSAKMFSHATSLQQSRSWISATSCRNPPPSPTLNENSLYRSHFIVQGSCVDMYNALWGSTYCNITCWQS